MSRYLAQHLAALQGALAALNVLQRTALPADMASKGQQTGQGLEQSGLACAVRAKQTDHFAFRN